MKTLKEIFEDANKLHVEASNPIQPAKLIEAAAMYHQVLNHNPQMWNVLFLLGTIEMQLGHNGFAIQIMEKVLQYSPKLPEALNNLGSAYKAEYNHDKAREYWEKALKVKEHGDYYNNLATLYINEGNAEEGERYARKATELDPDNPKTFWNLSLILLEQGCYGEGFEHYEAGLYSGDRLLRFYSKDPDDIPYWEGQKDKTVVVYGEQGMGDEILFSSALGDALATCKEVVLDCHPRMIDLFKRSFPDIKIIHGTRKKTTIEWPKDLKIDYRVAMGSLFYIYRQDGKFPRKTYLTPDPDKVKEYRQWLALSGPPPYIGISWQGGSKRTHSHERSFKLSHLKPILEQDATFISLQYTDGATEKLNNYEKDTGIKIHHWPEVLNAQEGGMNYDDTVALIAALDLVITPNTCAVHVCGAIGQECWTLTPDKCAWRYTQGDHHMMFYGDWVTQYREHGDWDKTINTVKYDLLRWLDNRDVA